MVIEAQGDFEGAEECGVTKKRQFNAAIYIKHTRYHRNVPKYDQIR